MDKIKNIMMLLLNIVLISSLLLITFKYRPVIASGSSMEPTFENNNYLFMDIQDKSYKHNDVIVFDTTNIASYMKGDLYIKRIIGLPGDRVEKVDDKILVNGKELNQDYLKDDKDLVVIGEYEKTVGSQTLDKEYNWDLESLSSSEHSKIYWEDESFHKTLVVPEGYYFVLGDHRSQSSDSRHFGYVKEEYIKGKVNENSWYNQLPLNWLSKTLKNLPFKN